MRPPKIMKEDAEAILKYIEGKVPAYTPEWTFGDDKDAGVTLTKIFAYMSELAIKRLNDAPQKHFLSFLETFNISLIPAQSARAPLTFTLGKGASSNVLIPESTQASASGPDGKPLIFETEENISATPSKLVSFFSVEKDEIFDHGISIDGKSSTVLFEGEKLQEHVLFIGDKNLLNIKNAKIIINIEGHELKNLASDNYISWDYGAGEVTEKKNSKEIKKIDWHPFQGFTINGSIIELTKYQENPEPIEELKLNGIKSRWIRCRVKDSRFLFVWGTVTGKGSSSILGFLRDELKFDLAGNAEIHNIDDNTIRVFTGEKTIDIVLDKNKEKADIKVNGSQIYTLRVSDENGRLDIYDSKIAAVKGIEISKITISTLPADGITEKKETTGIAPDLAFSSDIPVDTEKEFYPFGNKPQIYSTFYIASGDAFSKEGYEVTLSAVLFPGKPSCQQISENSGAKIPNSPQLSWEYWDGKGWGLLRVKETSENFTSFIEGKALRGNKNSIELDTDASDIDEVYTGMKVEITGGTGEGQVRAIKSYKNRVAAVEPEWSIQPDSTSTYFVFSCGDTAKPSLRSITVPSMPKMEPTGVNGKESYWIRVRLVGGDYGKEYEIRGNEVIQGNYCPPKMKNLRINYSPSDRAKVPEYILTRNSLLLKNCLDGKEVKKFRPFEPLPDVSPSLYMGFDKELRGGPISLFISVDSSLEYPEDFLPRIRWEYLSGTEYARWDELDLLDGTKGLKKSGMVKFVVPARMKGSRIFGAETDRYWIRASITGNFFEKFPLTAEDTSGNMGKKGSIFAGDGPGECRDTFEIFDESFTKGGEKKQPPKIRGFYLNSVWALQSRTITGEIIGSSTGEPNQVFRLMNTPVMKENVYVNEFSSLTEGERKSIKEGREVEEIKDDKGKVLEFWVKWDEVRDFIRSGGKFRHFIIDKTSGEIRFGDGKRGMVPPIGQNNIRVTYSTGGGKKGNLDAHSISKIQSAIDLIDKVDNPDASDGGTDTEEIDHLIERAPEVLKHRNRAVALSDFEWLTKEASRKVARVKVLPNFNAEGKYETGWVTIIIVPESMEPRPVPLPELKRRVETYLEKKSPNILTLRVIQPFYVKVTISAELITNSIDAVPVIEQEAKVKIAKFLHPLTGGVEGKGWNFGSAPCISDIYSILKGIDDVDYAKKVRIRLQAEENSKVIETIDIDTTGGMRLPEYALLFGGEHDITVNWERRDKFVFTKT